MLDEIAEAFAVMIPDPNWFTVAEMAKRWKVTDQGAQARLVRLEGSGLVIKHKDPINGRVYYERLVEDD
jgi:DNA-binding MarR family transcriptional regulator